MRECARVGIFGGTFNPIHLGHLRAAEEIVEALDLERMLFVPASQPPHKAADERDPIAPAQARLGWVREAVAGNPRFAVEDLELAREGPSYSVETLREIGSRLAPALPWFVIGSDAFAEIGDWREPAALFELAHFAVMMRPPRRRGSLAEWMPPSLRDAIELSADGQSGNHRTAGTCVRLLPIAALDVSASDIRARLRKGRSVRYLLPESVRLAVERSGAYELRSERSR